VYPQSQGGGEFWLIIVSVSDSVIPPRSGRSNHLLLIRRSDLTIWILDSGYEDYKAMRISIQVDLERTGFGV
jgi:hypothetical protein